MIGNGTPAVVKLHRKLEDVEPVWRAMEAAGTATPYQRYDWQQAYVSTLAVESGSDTFVVTISSDTDEPDILMPLALRRTAGVSIASFLGDRQANFHMPVFRGNAPAYSAERMRAILKDIARQHGAIDLFWLSHQPLTWNGRMNPLAEVRTMPSASQGYKLALDTDPDQTLQRVLSKDTRKKSRNKLRRLEQFGQVRHIHAQDEREIEQVLAAFQTQKSDRFRQLGIEDPFGSSEARRFLDIASRRQTPAGRPAIDLHALVCGERVVATLLGPADGRRFSGMAISFDPDPEIAKSSPGDLLLIEVIRHYARLGYTTLDLGIGEARYKEVFCEATQAVVDGLIPVTPRGALYALTATGLLGAKRRIKQTPWMFDLFKRLAALRNRGHQAA